MPIIPEYQGYKPRTSEGSTPRLPVQYGGMVGDALTNVGQAVSHVGLELDNKLHQLKQVEDLTKYSTESLGRLYDLHERIVSDPSFSKDPEGASRRFEQESKKIEQEYTSTIQDREVLGQWKQNYAQHSMSRLVELRNEGRKKRIDSARGTTLLSLDSLKDRVMQSGSQADMDHVLKTGLSAIDGMVAAGAYSHEEGAKLRMKWLGDVMENKVKADISANPALAAERLSSGYYKMLDTDRARALTDLAIRKQEVEQRKAETEATRQESERKKVILEKTYSDLQKQFADAPEAAVDWVKNPDNVPEMDVHTRSTLISMMAADSERKRRNETELRKRYDNVTNDDFIKKHAQNALTPAEVLGSDLLPNDKEHWLDTLNKGQSSTGKTDPNVKRQALIDIWEGRITDPKQLIPLKLSAQDMEDLNGSIKTSQDVTKSHYYDLALKAFDSKIGDDPDLEELKKERSNFAFILDRHIKQEGLKGEQIYKRGMELLEPTETYWYSRKLKEYKTAPWYREVSEPETFILKQDMPKEKDSTTFEMPEATVPIQGSQTGKIPIPKQELGRTSTSQEQKTFETIPIGLRGRLSGMLKENGYPVTDKNLLMLYEQYKVQGVR